MPKLTRRQTEIVALLGAGLSPKDIQKRMGIVTTTYHHHIEGAKKRMGAKTPWQLMFLVGRQIAQEKEETQRPANGGVDEAKADHVE